MRSIFRATHYNSNNNIVSSKEWQSAVSSSEIIQSTLVNMFDTDVSGGDFFLVREKRGKASKILYRFFKFLVEEDGSGSLKIALQEGLDLEYSNLNLPDIERMFPSDEKR